MVTAVDVVTALVVAVKVAVVAPAATVTDAGTWAAAAFELVRATTEPPVGAGLSKVTVPVEEAPPMTEAGVTLTPLRAATGAVTVSVAVRLTLLYAAVIVTAVEEATVLVVAVNV